FVPLRAQSRRLGGAATAAAHRLGADIRNDAADQCSLAASGTGSGPICLRDDRGQCCGGDVISETCPVVPRLHTPAGINLLVPLYTPVARASHRGGAAACSIAAAAFLFLHCRGCLPRRTL